MKIITSALALLTVLSVSIRAQTSSAEEPILQIKSFGWVENVTYIPCTDCAGMPQVAVDYRNRNRADRGDFLLRIVLKNKAKKSIKSVSLDFVFRVSETEREFLTYHHRFEQEIGSGKTEVIQHEIKEGTELHNFRPLAPSAELLDRTRYCRNGPWFRATGSRKLMKIRDNPKLVKAFPCYYLPSVTRIEYIDGSVWQP